VIASASEAFDVLCGLRLATGATWGAAATSVQIEDARAVLDLDGPRRHWIGRPRGYAKSDDQAAYQLADLITGRIPIQAPAYTAASDRGQAGLVHDSFAGFVDRSGLASAIDVQAFRAVHRSTGARIEVLAADSSGTYGLRPSKMAIDELCQWPDTRQARRFFEALSSSLPKVPESVGVISTTAGTPGHWSHKVFLRALAEPVLWRVSMTHDAAPWIDPALIEAERRALTESAFARLWQNRWADADDALVSADDLGAAAVLDGPLPRVRGVSYVATLDVGLVNDATVLVVAHGESDPGGVRVVVDLVRRWRGTRRRPVDLDEVTEAAVAVHAEYGARVVVDPAKAEHLLQRLRKRGIPASQFNFTTTSVGLLAGCLLRALRARSILLPKDDVLLEELASVRIIENSAGVPRLTHDGSGHDDQAVALSLAVYHLTDGRHQGLTLHVPQGEMPPVQLFRKRSLHDKEAAPPAIVKEGELRPTDRLISFAAARRHPNYRPPGGARR
jgi:hypothetical protein